jgi:DNA repair protein RadD
MTPMATENFGSYGASTITLYPYQEAALEATQAALEQGKHPVCAIATGGGKGVLIAELCRRLPGRILVVTHRKELIEQNESELLRLGGDDDTGVYSAGLGRRDLDARVLFAGVQSIHRRMDDLQAAGAFDYIIVDENHLVPPPSTPSMYGAVLSACEGAQRIGFSATPYRLDDGPIWGDPALGADTWFDVLAVDIGITELTEQGYLAPLVGVKTVACVDLSHVRTRAGDFVTSDLSQASSEESVVRLALDEICDLARDRRHWLLFCVDRAHAKIVVEGLRERGIHAEMVLGNTPKEKRAELLTRFKSGGFRALVNVEVLTTGFNAPNTDCVALLRASQSKSLIVQCLGRVTRLSPETGKRDALVLDLAGNLERHVPLDGIPHVMRSPRLADQEAREAAVRVVQEEREEEERKARHGTEAARIDPLRSGPLAPTSGETLHVVKVHYQFKAAKRYPDRTNLMVMYTCQTRSGHARRVTQFVLIEYPGRPGHEARAWFERRGITMPRRASDARKLVWRAPTPHTIVVRKDGSWDQVVMEQFDPNQLSII